MLCCLVKVSGMRSHVIDGICHASAYRTHSLSAPTLVALHHTVEDLLGPLLFSTSRCHVRALDDGASTTMPDVLSRSGSLTAFATIALHETALIIEEPGFMLFNQKKRTVQLDEVLSLLSRTEPAYRMAPSSQADEVGAAAGGNGGLEDWQSVELQLKGSSLRVAMSTEQVNNFQTILEGARLQLLNRRNLRLSRAGSPESAGDSLGAVRPPAPGDSHHRGGFNVSAVRLPGLEPHLYTWPSDPDVKPSLGFGPISVICWPRYCIASLRHPCSGSPLRILHTPRVPRSSASRTKHPAAAPWESDPIPRSIPSTNPPSSARLLGMRHVSRASRQTARRSIGLLNLQAMPLSVG